MQLPEDVPEELPVACAGRLALMNVRSQTVTFGGTVISASRFEAVCGKGDAKKWKSSLWAATPEGIPEQVTADFCVFSTLLPFTVGHTGFLRFSTLLPFTVGHSGLLRVFHPAAFHSGAQ